ncbi:hypothetical protein TSOC_006802 [Tetrabaena socialis]|uniref:Serine aminopeptidase S33 domain-containing protein n=1 Tax=Tetrabaena socialis TaxID=47790 RepID=A0A2J8A2N4_9CHLO|nr:hypothetical protein TSOC_006802 [Tetrabaena socialis]|eukprot:PNH06780.1 hypothetical protein TSOC_006802 [Tetrabaena socialis]
MGPQMSTPGLSGSVCGPAREEGRAGAMRGMSAPQGKGHLCTLVRPRLAMLCTVAVCEELFAHLEEIRTPFLAVHAPEDSRCEICNSEALVARAATTDKQLLAAPGGSHMLFLDKPDITARVLAHVTGWLTQRC